MVTAKKENLGKMPCPCCGEPVAVKKAMTGTLSYQCQDADCETSGYAGAHTAAARKWLGKIGPRAAPISTAPEPTAKNPIEKNPIEKNPIEKNPPAAKPARQPFSLGNL